MLCLQEIAALILHKNERERERAHRCIFRWKDFFLACFWTVLYWNVQGNVHVWDGYVIHLASNENLLYFYVHMLWVCVIGPFQSTG